MAESSFFNMVDGPEIGSFKTLKLLGEFDLNEVANFDTKVKQLLQLGVKNIILDLSDLEYLDSSGIGCIVRLYRDTEERGKGKLFIYNPKEFIEELFQISNLTNFLKVIHTQEELEKNCKS